MTGASGSADRAVDCDEYLTSTTEIGSIDIQLPPDCFRRLRFCW